MTVATADDRARLERLRTDLLRVHRAVLDAERARYEAVHGAIPNSMLFLQLVIDDPWFAWVRPMVQLVLQIDERTADRTVTLGAQEARELRDRARALLSPNAAGDDFQRRLHEIGVASPTLAHLLQQAGSAPPR